MNAELLKVRADKKARKPQFKRQQTNLQPQFGAKWTKPRGMHSKMRKGYRGKGRTPAIGYSAPNEVKGLNRKGFREIIVHNIVQLQKVDPKTEVAVLSTNLGMKKRIEFLKKAEELKITVSNVKDPKVYLENAAKKIADRKKEASDRKAKKDNKTEEKKKEDKKKEEKKEEKKTEVKPEAKQESKPKGAYEQ